MEGIQNLVVGFDGSQLSEQALRRASELAMQAPFALVHVVVAAQKTERGVELPQGPVLTRFAAIHLLRLTVERLLKSWDVQRPHVRQVIQLRYGHAARIIVDAAYRYHADLIFVGAHGDGPPHTRLGRVALEVLDQTHDLKVRVEALSTLARRAPALDQLQNALLSTLAPAPSDPWSQRRAGDLPS